VEEERIRFFRMLIDTPSPSGFEEQVQQLFLERVKDAVDLTYKDVHGNAFGVINPDCEHKLMLAGHCDEVGLMVSYIDKEGYVYFSTVGGIDPQITQGMPVVIHTAKGPVSGVIGKKPIHLLEEKERQKVARIEEQWIDIGAKDGEEARSMVQIGDPITFDIASRCLAGERITGKGIDDKVGVFVVCEVLRELGREKQSLAFGVYGVSTVQEELGLRGAKTSAFGINPKIGIAIDVTFASDCPNIDKKKVGDISLGKGPVLARGPNINSKLWMRIKRVAEENNIPYQVQAEARATGTDANVIQTTRSGVVTALLSIPNRYMHTPSEIVDMQDVENAIRLLVLFIKSLKVEENWIP